MTREIKLALVLGFGLLLFSGILVSDHLAARQRGEAENLATADIDSAVGPIKNPESIRSNLITPAVATTLVQGNTPQGTTLPSGQPESMAIVPNAFPVAPTQLAAAPERLHSIQQGETIASVCRSQYGDTKLLDELLAYNKSVVPDPSRMRVGVTIRLPDAAVLRGEQVAMGAPAPAPVLGDPVRTPTSGGSLRTYTVKPGDIPGRIAQSQLGSAKHAGAILKANPGLDPKKLKPGMVINLPNVS